MHHVIGFQTNVTSTDAYTRLTALPDSFFGVLGTTFYTKRQLYVLGAFASGSSAGYLRARIVVGGNPLSPAWVRPISGALTTPTDANMMAFPRRPIVLPADTEFAVEAIATGLGSIVNVLLWISDAPPEPVRGEGLWLRFGASGSANYDAGNWQRQTISSEKTLPDGLYAVVGAEAWLDTGSPVAFRIGFWEAPNRPGGLLLDAATSRGPSFMHDGSLGVWGYFRPYQPPYVEVLVHAASAAATVDTYLKVVRVDEAEQRRIGARAADPIRYGGCR